MDSVIVYIGLGSNLNQPVKQLERAITALAKLPNTRLVQTSKFYKSRAMTLNLESSVELRKSAHPLGAPRKLKNPQLNNNKPDDGTTPPHYINAVTRLITSLPPLDLLDALQSIESAQGRKRSNASQWDSRTLDLDLLFYGKEVINCSRLTVPHYGITQRDFVLVPLLEITPDLCFPNGDKVAMFLNSCNNYQLKALPLNQFAYKL